MNCSPPLRAGTCSETAAPAWCSPESSNKRSDILPLSKQRPAGSVKSSETDCSAPVAAPEVHVTSLTANQHVDCCGLNWAVAVHCGSLTSLRLAVPAPTTSRSVTTDLKPPPPAATRRQRQPRGSVRLAQGMLQDRRNSGRSGDGPALRRAWRSPAVRRHRQTGRKPRCRRRNENDMPDTPPGGGAAMAVMLGQRDYREPTG